eukprot:Skav208092  [mRNA]  locus=scaffold1681:97420:99062:- [translate_table: standard]
MSGFDRVNDGSDGELDHSFQPKRSTVKKMTLAVTTAVVVLVGILALSMNGFSRGCIDIAALQGKSGLDLESAIRTKSQKLIEAVKKNQTLADETVLKAMVKAGHQHAENWEKHHVRKLDTLATVKAIKGYRQGQKAKWAGIQECSFNILEAFVSAVGMGDDINAIIRTCPAPRDGESELACQVNGAILGAWVGNLATKLALAASNCALHLNVDASCSAGVTGFVSRFTQISVLGDQTVRGRRLLIGEGAVGNGVQCGVDVGMVAANIANMGLAINKAVNINKCKKSTFRTPLNVFKGIPQSLCTVDIGGAVAYIGQVVTFINLIIVHCQWPLTCVQDFLDVNALCAAPPPAAAAIAPYGAAVHAACANNHFLKTPKAQGLIVGTYTAPNFDPLAGTRRLQNATLKESLAQIEENRQNLEELKKMTDVPEPGNTEADLQTLLNLMGSQEQPRAAWPFEC